MRPLNLIAFLLFLGGAVWALTRSERSVREIQRTAAKRETDRGQLEAALERIMAR